MSPLLMLSYLSGSGTQACILSTCNGLCTWKPLEVINCNGDIHVYTGVLIL